MRFRVQGLALGGLAFWFSVLGLRGFGSGVRGFVNGSRGRAKGCLEVHGYLQPHFRDLGELIDNCFGGVRAVSGFSFRDLGAYGSKVFWLGFLLGLGFRV